MRIMPTNCLFSSLAVTLVVVLLLEISPFGTCNSFCVNTLSRPSCPDLPTFDLIDIAAYRGRWYEIGSNAYFKNLEEVGGTCVTADYSFITNDPAARASFSFNNSFNKQIGPLATSVVQGISLRAGEICHQARKICVKTNQQAQLFRALSIIDGLASKIVQNFSLEGAALASLKLRIETDVYDINQSLDYLSANISQLQLINSNLSQGLGDQKVAVDSLAAVVRQANSAAEAIVTSVNDIGLQRLQIANIAGLLFGISKAESHLFGENSSLTTTDAAVLLFRAAALIQAAEEIIPGPLAVIRTILAGTRMSTPMLDVDRTGPSGSTQFLQGQAVQTNFTHPGKLVFNASGGVDLFPGAFNRSADSMSPTLVSRKYWILAAEGRRELGYDAALVYGCYELPGGGVKQPLLILSRNRTLAADVVARFFSLAATLGIDMDCDEPFVFSQQGDSCTYPPV